MGRWKASRTTGWTTLAYIIAKFSVTLTGIFPMARHTTI